MGRPFGARVVAAAAAAALALCVPGAALAGPGRQRTGGHYVYSCVKVRDRAKGDLGKICINAFLNPADPEWHFRAKVSFRSISGGKLSKASAIALYLKLGHRSHRYGYRHDPKTSAKHGAAALKMVTVWIADPHSRNPLAVVRNACLTWRNGGHACRHGYLSGGMPGYIS